MLLVGFVIVALLSLAGWAAFSEPQRLFTPVDGWSRARLVATSTLREPATIVLDEGGTSYMLYFGGSESSASIHMLALDVGGNELWQSELVAGVRQPENVRLLATADGLYLLWLSEGELYRTLVNYAGEMVAEIEPVTFPVELTSFDAQLFAGAVRVAAGGDVGDPGVYLWSGVGEPALLDELGLAPLLQVDETGMVYAVWQQQTASRQRQLLFGRLGDDGLTVAEPASLTTIEFRQARLRGPWFAAAGGYGYLVWTIDIVEGISAGVSQGRYFSFSLADGGTPVSSGDLAIAYSRQRQYDLPAGALAAGPRAALPTGFGRKATPLEGVGLSPVAGLGEEGLLALRFSVEYLINREASQLGLLYWRAGEPAGYQMLTFTRSGSLQPSLAQRRDGHLVATWLEGSAAGADNVYLAGTHPDMIAASEGLTLQDYGLFVADSFSGMVQSVVFAPFAFAFWSVLPFVLLLVSGYWRQEDPGWRQPAFYVPIILAILVFWAGKYLMLREAWGAYVPFSAWVPIITGPLEPLFQLLVPLIIFLVALFAAWRLTRNRLKPPILVFFFIYAAVDTVLTMSIYGGYLYSAF